MSHGSYDLNLGSDILILGRDIRLRSWPNIGDSYSILGFARELHICNKRQIFKVVTTLELRNPLIDTS